MKLLVTGGAGFIGSEVVRQLVRADHEVTVLDCLTYAGDLERLRAQAGKYRFVRGEAGSRVVEREIAEFRPEIVVHMAAETHVDRSLSVMGHFLFESTNVLSTIMLLEDALRHGVARFVYVSTDEVYGEAPADRGSRVEDPMRPQSPYAASKAAADCFAQAWAHTYDLDVIVTRGSNTYGPWQHPEKFIPTVIAAVLDGRPVPLYGDGLQARDWMHVSDHAAAIVAAALAPREEGRDQGPTIFNVGTGTTETNADVAALVASCLGREWTAQEVADRPGHVRRHAVDMGGAPAWVPRPTVDLPDGIEETCRWYARNEEWWRRKIEQKSHVYHLEERDREFRREAKA